MTTLLKQQLKPKSSVTKLGHVLPRELGSHSPALLSEPETFPLAPCQEPCPVPSLGWLIPARAVCQTSPQPSPGLGSPASLAPHPQGHQPAGLTPRFLETPRATPWPEPQEQERQKLAGFASSRPTTIPRVPFVFLVVEKGIPLVYPSPDPK